MATRTGIEVSIAVADAVKMCNADVIAAYPITPQTHIVEHLAELVEDATTAYMAPEALTDPEATGETLDVFALGAIAYHLFAGRPPASSFVELSARVAQGKGLDLATVVDGVSEKLRDLVRYSTYPEVSNRYETVADFLEILDEYEDDLTTPDDGATIQDPTAASTGNVFPGGFQVKRRLGSGSTAIAFLVDRGGRELVLKVALDPEQNARLRDEGEVLAKLHHQCIVACHEVTQVGDRMGMSQRLLK